MGKNTLHILHIGLVALVLLLSACNVTKFVPENQYLLNKAHIVVTDTKNVDPADLRAYLRQKPNTEVLGFWKLQLHIYNTAPKDTTSKANKRLARNAHRVGEAPEIYDEHWTDISMIHLQRAMQNKGYFNATVDTAIVINKRKLDLTYLITAHRPFYLQTCFYDLPQEDLYEVATDTQHSLLEQGMLVDADVLNAERKRIETEMRNRGYFYFEKEMLHYELDSMVGDHQVNAYLSLQPYVSNPADTLYQKVFRTFRIARVNYDMDYDRKQLRNRVLVRNTKIQVGELYNQHAVDRTYELLNGLGMIKYVDIAFTPVGLDELECHITLNRQKLHTVSAQLEGTYTSGDWGIATEIGYTNRNMFCGSEELSIKARGGYEWRQNGGRAIEGLLNVGLAFPNRLKLEVEGRYQNRPEEFNRIIANAALRYQIKRSSAAPWTHSFRFADISYVYLPWISDEFRQTFLRSSNLLKYSYEDHFIMAFGYQVNYTSYRPNQPLRSFGTVALSVETAGNVLQALAKVAHFASDEDGKYKIGKILFSQYAKFDFNFTGHHIINGNHRFVYHGAIGVAVPYGNASAIPFEKRYFAGGANGVRGWTARALGPGAYRGDGTMINYDNQAGDIRLDLSAEYRVRLWKFIHAAAFVDAGNIWTIREYESQQGGMFRWNTFYKQIALSYGAGLRLDFSFLILRLDMGVRLYDPARIVENKEWRTAGNGLNWRDDFALHFAIGYPF